jgi:hypothetical protein
MKCIDLYAIEATVLWGAILNWTATSALVMSRLDKLLCSLMNEIIKNLFHFTK